jgi:hypothetical protein
MQLVADINRELLPTLNTLASINHLSIYVGSLAGTRSDDQQLVSLNVASVSLIDGLLHSIVISVRDAKFRRNCKTESLM